MKRIMATFADLKAMGHPYTRQHTGRLERANRFPKRRKFGNRVVWMMDEYEAWLLQRFRKVENLAD